MDRCIVHARAGVNVLHPPIHIRGRQVAGPPESVAVRRVVIPETRLEIPKTFKIYKFAGGDIQVVVPAGTYGAFEFQEAIRMGHNPEVPEGTVTIRVVADRVYLVPGRPLIIQAELAALLGIPEVVTRTTPIRWGAGSVKVYTDLIDGMGSYEEGKPSGLLANIAPLNANGPTVYEPHTPIYLPTSAGGDCSHLGSSFKLWTSPPSPCEVVLELRWRG